jgi:hypothetical protein
MEAIIVALKRGMIVIFDISLLNPGISEKITKQIVKVVFSHNQTGYTSISEKPMPTILTIEEAQTVLGGTRLNENDPIVSWVKQGRKYNLGSVMITQQPGSISDLILSQGDNWFVFHLVSGGDLGVLKKANGHFSDDILQSLLNEPIKGQGYFWSSESERSYPIPVRILAFEKKYSLISKKDEEPECTMCIKNIVDELIQNIYQGNVSFVDALEKEKGSVIEKVKIEGKFLREFQAGKLHGNYAACIIRDHINKTLVQEEKLFKVASGMICECLDAIIGIDKWEESDGEHKGKKTKYYRQKKQVVIDMETL